MSRILTPFTILLIVIAMIAISFAEASSSSSVLKHLKRNLQQKHQKLHRHNSQQSKIEQTQRSQLDAKLEAKYPSANIPDIAPLRKDTVTVSGFDGGASFAQQLHIACSSLFRGGAFLSTIPYLCAEGTLAGSTACLETPWLINNAALYSEAIVYVADRTVDSLSNLKDQYVYIGASPYDTVVNVGGSKAAATMYSDYLGVANVETDFSLDGAEHAWVTSKYGNDCGVLGAPYVSKCSQSFALDGMKKMFEFMLKSNNTPVKPAASTFNQSNLYVMSQKNFGANPTDNSLADKGFVFVPPQCVRQNGNPSNNNKCHLHVHFHGCNQSSSAVFDQYVLATQLNEFAVANDVVIWYPQATPNVEFLNPMGCFDFYGYEYGLPYPLAYATQVGGQIKIMKTVINDFIAGFM